MGLSPPCRPLKHPLRRSQGPDAAHGGQEARQAGPWRWVASLCASLGPGLEPAPWPIRMGSVLVRLTNERLGRADDLLPLVLALEWARGHRAAFDHQADGAELAAALVRHLQATDDAEAAERPDG